MATMSLVCPHCRGTMKLDDSMTVATCEYCFAQTVIKEDKTVQEVTQYVTKHVYGYEGKDAEELLDEGFALLERGSDAQANAKFKRAIDVEPGSWGAWYGYAETGGARDGYLSMLPAFEQAMSLAATIDQCTATFAGVVSMLPNSNSRSAFLKAYNRADGRGKRDLFYAVLKVVGCDESEIARLVVDACPNDWRAHFAMAQARKVRARWAKKKLFSGAPEEVRKVADLFAKAYGLAKQDGPQATKEIQSYIDNLAQDPTYNVLAEEIKNRVM